MRQSKSKEMDNSTLSIELEIFTPYELVRWREKGKFNEIKLPEKKVWSKMKRSQWIESLFIGNRRTSSICFRGL